MNKTDTLNRAIAIKSVINSAFGMDTSIPDDLISRIITLWPEGKKMSPDDLELREHVAKTIADSLSVYPDLGYIAGAIVYKNLETSVRSFYSELDLESTSEELKPFYYIDSMGLLAPGLMKAISSVSDKVIEIIKRARAKMDTPGSLSSFFDYFGARTVIMQYITRDNSHEGKPIEDVIQMYARVSATIHLAPKDLSTWKGIVTDEELSFFEETLEAFLSKKISHASPTVFAGHQNASCFLLDMDDSIRGIYGKVTDCALISQKAGGIGISVSKIRSRGSVIRGANGVSSGIIPMLKMFNGSVKYVDQGGRRPGAAAVYIEPWHAEIFEFLELRLNAGPEDLRARDLFYALWVPDLFMERLEANGLWSLMCPNECPGLTECYGEEFNKIYIQYESEKKYRRQVPASKLWNAICNTSMETGMPYILFKDASNRTSNQQNVSIIRSSNLCAEIVEVSGTLPNGEHHTAVCNLASIALPAFIRDSCKRFDTSKPVDPKSALDYDSLKKTARVLTRNLDNLISVNDYPIESTRASNLALRPIGIGIQGLADVFHELFISPDSEEAKAINRMIMETIYLGFLEETCALSRELGSYSYFEGSPASRGILNFDYYSRDGKPVKPELWDFDKIREDIRKYGMRNSLGLALMPTASTAQILGNTESFEFPSYFFGTRRVKSGEYQVINRSLISVLRHRNLWSREVRDAIIINGGKVSGIEGIPDDIQKVFVTSFDVSQKTAISLAADRQAFICQSQSMNLYLDSDGSDAYRKLTKMLMYGWKRGLKTGMYYLRTRPARPPSKVTIRPQVVKLENTESETIDSKSEKEISEESDSFEDSSSISDSSGTSSPVSLSDDTGVKNIVCTEEICVVCSA